MHPSTLVGKYAVRTKPIYKNGFEDDSYHYLPIKIIKVTNNEIFYDVPLYDLRNEVLDKYWIDNNWKEWNGTVMQ